MFYFNFNVIVITTLCILSNKQNTSAMHDGQYKFVHKLILDFGSWLQLYKHKNALSHPYPNLKFMNIFALTYIKIRKGIFSQVPNYLNPSGGKTGIFRNN